MKKLYLIFLLIIIGLSSCQKSFLTRDNPIATTDAEWWKTDAQLQSALNVVYSAIPAGAFYYTPNPWLSFSALTDDAVWAANYFGEINAIALGNAAPNMPQENWGVITNAIQPLWRADFAAIRNANRFIAHAGGAYDDSALIKRYILEARALRAWYHLDLLLYYGNIPVVTTAVTPAESNLKRNTAQEDINFITSELDTCAAGLPVSYTATVDKYRITKGACLTMKAWAFLNAHMYQQAAAAAKQVIDLGVYKLYYNPADSANSYFDLFQYAGNTNNPESILLSHLNRECYGRDAPPVAGGTSNVNPTASLVNTYETRQGKTITELGADSIAMYERYPDYNDNRDPRLKASIFYPGETFVRLLNPFDQSATNPNRIGAENSTRTGYWVRKYVDLLDIGHPYGSSLDFMVFRYADVLLMYVEGEVESGRWNDGNVINYLNAIRHRAGMPDVDLSKYNSQQKMRELYQRERRVELAFEGSRLFDIRRWQIGAQVMNGTVYGATDPATGQAVVVEQRHFDPAKDYLWPIPVGEMQGNSNMVQNPGY